MDPSVYDMPASAEVGDKQPTPQRKKAKPELRDALGAMARGAVGAKTPTNSTAVRGLDYNSSLKELAAEQQDEELGPVLRHLAQQLLEQRGDAVHYYRVRVVLTVRCFLDVLKILLRYDEMARAVWFSRKNVRVQLTTGFASYMAAAGTMDLDTTAYPPALRTPYWQALQLVSSTFEEAERGWENVSGAAARRVPIALNAQWRASNIAAVVENDELVTDQQGSKLVTALLAVVTSEHDFFGDAATQFKQRRRDCKTMLRYLVESTLALFPQQGEDRRHGDDDDDDDDDDEDARIQAAVEAAFHFDEELAADPSHQPREDCEAKVEGDAVLDMTEQERQHIVAFTAIAERVVREFAEKVCKQFPGITKEVQGRRGARTEIVAAAIELPARTATERRKVLFVAHSILDAALINSHRQLGVISSEFYLRDFKGVHENLYVGDQGGAFHAGPAGFTLVVNCAAAEVPNYYEAPPSRAATVEYVSLALPGGPRGIEAMTQHDWQSVCDAVSRHRTRNGKVLVHCVEGRHRSAALVFRVLQRCYGLDERAAFGAVFRAVPHMDFSDVPQNLFEQNFDAFFGAHLASCSLIHSTEQLRIRYGERDVLPVTTLAPFYTFKTGGVKCSLVDYAIEYGIKRFGYESVHRFFAEQAVHALADSMAPIVLVCYPPHSRVAKSQLAPVVHAMCKFDPDRFKDGSHILERSADSPQRSKGGDRSIDVQLSTVSCVAARLQKFPVNATFVCLDDVLSTGASFHVFARKMLEAEINGDRLRGLALGRFSAHGPAHETQSEFVIPAGEIAADVTVSSPANVCIDVAPEFEPEAQFQCQVVRQDASSKTLAFQNHAAALGAAKAWLAGPDGVDCCPHFAIESVGFPCQVVDSARLVTRVERVSGKELFILDAARGTTGTDRNDAVKQAQSAWKELEDAAVAQWDARSAAPVEETSVRAHLLKHFPAGQGGNLDWAILPHGGGNLVKWTSKTAFRAALKSNVSKDSGLKMERAFGAVRSRTWVATDAASVNVDDALQCIQALSPNKVICTLRGSSLTRKMLSRHDGGTLSVVGQTLRVECPQVKWGCDPTWSPTMQFCSAHMLGLISWNVLKEAWEKEADWRDQMQAALLRYFHSLEMHCTVTHFDRRTAPDAAEWIVEELRSGRAPQENAIALVALMHYSRKDIYRCMVYRDKLRGLATAGGSLLHIGLHLPDLPWTGSTEVQKTALSFRELSGVSREASPFPREQAEERASVLRSLLSRLPQPVGEELLTAAQATGTKTKAEAEAKFKAAKKVLDSCRERVLMVCGMARELPSLENAPAHHAALSREIVAALDHCNALRVKMSQVKFPEKVDDNGKERKLGKGLKNDLIAVSDKVKKVLDQCKAMAGRARPVDGDELQPPMIPEVSPKDAAQSARERAITIVFANDSGAGSDFVTGIPEPLAFYVYEVCSGRNVASHAVSVAQEADAAASRLFDYFRLNEHTLRFELTSGMAKEARNTALEQKGMAEYVADQNTDIARVCRGALSREFYPYVARNNPLTSAGRRVAESLLELDGSSSIMCAPHKFLGSASTTQALCRVESILLRAVPLCDAYNVSLYRDARGRTRRAVDKLAQMQTNRIELVALQYAHDPIVQLMHRVSHGDDVDVLDELRTMVIYCSSDASLLNVWDVLNECPVERAEQLPYLIIKSCEVLRALQGSIVNYSKQRAHDEIAALRASWSRTGKDPPSAILCQGMWNRRAPGRGSFGTAWQRAEHQRATNRNLARRAKQIRWHLKKKRLGQESTVTANFLSSVSIQSKRISEIRSTKQKLAFAALLSHERIDTRGPPQSLFPGLSKDRPWKLRWAKGDRYVVHRDHQASCALAILGMWERYAFAHNQLQGLLDESRCVLLRPAVYLYHTDYAKWTNGTLKANKAQRW